MKTGSFATLGGVLMLNSASSLFAQENKKSRVVLVRNNDVLDHLNKPKMDIVQKMLDDAVTTLFDIDDPVKAWQSIIKPHDIVGIKTNVWNHIPTTKEVETSLKKRVMDAGVKEQNIGINDRGILNDPIFKKATALINARPMRTHHWSGVGTLIKNYIMFVEKPYEYHDDSCADLAAIWNLPHVKGKTRLNVLVMFTPLFYGTGPHHFSPKYVWKYNGILVGTDPVAVDSVGVNIITAKRREFFGEERPISPPPKHIYVADTKYKLGNSDLNKIELIKLGTKEGILI